MTLVLERPRVCGDRAAAAVVRHSVAERRWGRHVAITASRSPVALLVRHGDHLAAFTPQGDPLALDDVERMCPGAISAFVGGSRSQTP